MDTIFGLLVAIVKAATFLTAMIALLTGNNSVAIGFALLFAGTDAGNCLVNASAQVLREYYAKESVPVE